MKLNKGDTISLGFKSHDKLTSFSTPIENTTDVLLSSNDELDKDNIIMQYDNHGVAVGMLHGLVHTVEAI